MEKADNQIKKWMIEFDAIDLPAAEFLLLTPAIKDVFRLTSLLNKPEEAEGISADNYSDSYVLIDELLRGACELFAQALRGDEDARVRLAAVFKMIFSKAYGVQPSVIEALASSRHLSPRLLRAYRVISLMKRFSSIVRPVRAGNAMNGGAVKVIKRPELEKPSAPQSKFREFYLFAKNRVRKNTTLQALAIDYYLQQEAGNSSRDDVRNLKEDLRQFRENEARFWKPGMPIIHEWGAEIKRTSKRSKKRM
jgi:hypothetical protein